MIWRLVRVSSHNSKKRYWVGVDEVQNVGTDVGCVG
jgi:hypothetical protein